MCYYGACTSLSDVTDIRGRCGEHAATMLQFMCKMIRGVAMFIKECSGVYYGIDPGGGQASDQP